MALMEQTARQETGSDELMTGLNISKNINGFDMKLGSNYSLLSQIPDYGVNLEISNKF